MNATERQQRFDNLMEYLHALIQLKNSDYKVYDEINQVLAEMKRVLELNA